MTSPTILYIEDHPASRRVMSLMLQDVMGYKVVVLDNSAGAVAALEAHEHDFNIIFLDLNVEPISGLDLVGQLIGHPRCASTRIVALTAATTSSDIKQMRAAGFHGLIGKPISPTRFPEQVERLLAGEAVWEVE